MLTVLFGQMTKIHVFGKMLTPQVLLRPNANPSRSVVPNADASRYVWSNDYISFFGELPIPYLSFVCPILQKNWPNAFERFTF